jgi:hypothetical protein
MSVGNGLLVKVKIRRRRRIRREVTRYMGSALQR